MKLIDAEQGQEVVVRGIDDSAPDRARLLDLGFVPGTKVRRHIQSPLGDPVAYIVRGTTIALRREQASRIEVSKP